MIINFYMTDWYMLWCMPFKFPRYIEIEWHHMRVKRDWPHKSQSLVKIEGEVIRIKKVSGFKALPFYTQPLQICLKSYIRNSSFFLRLSFTVSIRHPVTWHMLYAYEGFFMYKMLNRNIVKVKWHIFEKLEV